MILHLFILGQDLPKPIRANFILNVETDELFITAGLQDRVVQVFHMSLWRLGPTPFEAWNMSQPIIFLKVYEGLVYMDFSKHLMDERGHGIVFDSFLARLQTNYFISLKLEIFYSLLYSFP